MQNCTRWLVAQLGHRAAAKRSHFQCSSNSADLFHADSCHPEPGCILNVIQNPTLFPATDMLRQLCNQRHDHLPLPNAAACPRLVRPDRSNLCPDPDVLRVLVHRRARKHMSSRKWQCRCLGSRLLSRTKQRRNRSVGALKPLFVRKRPIRRENPTNLRFNQVQIAHLWPSEMRSASACQADRGDLARVR